DGARQDLRGLEELAPDVDVRVRGLDGVRADQAPLDEGVRGPADQLAVLEGPRLGFVRVAEQEVLLPGLERHERPLHARGEAGPAAAAQPGGLHLVDDLLALHPQRLAQRLVPAALLPAGERARLRVAEVLRQDERLARVLVWV